MKTFTNSKTFHKQVSSNLDSTRQDGI